MKNHNEDKWLLVSCLQKSIRKGFCDLALNYADKLYEIERSYLVYRLSVIAIEDIGLGNVDLIHDFLSTEIKKANIEERGGKDYIMKIVESLSLSGKDRSACDLVSLAYFYQEKTNINKKFEEVFLDNNDPLVNRVLAGWEILGAQKLKNPLVKNIENNDLEKFLELNSQITSNKKILEIIKFCHTIHREPHFISFGILASVYEKEKAQKMKIGNFTTGDIVEKKYPLNLVHDKWLIDGVDWHTKEGKSAIYDFLKEKTEITNYLKTMVIDQETIATLLGMLLFRSVGHQVDKRLFYPSAVAILKGTEQLTFKQMTYSEQADFFKANKLLEKDMHKLIEKIHKQFIVPDPQYFPF